MTPVDQAGLKSICFFHVKEFSRAGYTALGREIVITGELQK